LEALFGSLVVDRTALTVSRYTLKPIDDAKHQDSEGGVSLLFLPFIVPFADGRIAVDAETRYECHVSL
jgi:hypothetical protein